MAASAISDNWRPWQPWNMLPRVRDKRKNNKHLNSRDKRQLGALLAVPSFQVTQTDSYFQLNSQGRGVNTSWVHVLLWVHCGYLAKINIIPKYQQHPEHAHYVHVLHFGAWNNGWKTSFPLEVTIFCCFLNKSILCFEMPAVMSLNEHLLKFRVFPKDKKNQRADIWRQTTKHIHIHTYEQFRHPLTQTALDCGMFCTC